MSNYLGKKKGRKFCFGALKVDMSKAYDKVDWNFLRAVLNALNFNDSWVKWIMECVTTVNYTLIINGNLSHSFTPKKGLRQGDPFPLTSSLCVLIYIIGPHASRKSKENQRNQIRQAWHPLDDALLFFKHDAQSLANLQHILNWYCSLLGGSINFSKSDLYCSPNMAEEVKINLAQSL